MKIKPFKTKKDTSRRSSSELQSEDEEVGLRPDSHHTATIQQQTPPYRRPLGYILLLILFLGSATAAGLLLIGIRAERESVDGDFNRAATDLVNKIHGAWEDYVTAAGFLHGQCRQLQTSSTSGTGEGVTRRSFRQVYEYLVQTAGLDVQAVQWDPRVLHSERAAMEESARQYYAEYFKHKDYQGFVGFNTDNSTTLEPRDDAEVYYPIRKYFTKSIPLVHVKAPKEAIHAYILLCLLFLAILLHCRLYGTDSRQRSRH